MLEYFWCVLHNHDSCMLIIWVIMGRRHLFEWLSPWTLSGFQHFGQSIRLTSSFSIYAQDPFGLMCIDKALVQEVCRNVRLVCVIV